jgi:hypothetical protein
MNYPSLPPGWVMTTDPVSGRVYYANPTTGETTWEPPAPVLPPPPGVFLTPPPPPPNSHIASEKPQMMTLQPPPPPHTMGPSVLIPSVRSLLDYEYTVRQQQSSESTVARKMELDRMSAGIIADLCNVTKDTDDDHFVPYTPLQPYELPVGARAPHIEPGRVDIRLMALYDKLSQQ